MSLCQNGCEYKGYDINKSNIQCKCDVKIKINFIINIEINKDEMLLYKFKNIGSITNFYVIKCYRLLFSKEGIIKNIGFYVLLIKIFINIILVIVFTKKGHKYLYNKIKELINYKKGKNNIFKNEKNSNKKKFNDNNDNNQRNKNKVLNIINKNDNNKKEFVRKKQKYKTIQLNSFKIKNNPIKKQFHKTRKNNHNGKTKKNIKVTSDEINENKLKSSLSKIRIFTNSLNDNNPNIPK